MTRVRDVRLTARVHHIALDRPLRDLHSPPGYRELRLVVTWRGSVVAELGLPFMELVPARLLAALLAERLAERVRREELDAALRLACGAGARAPARRPTVSVVVCTRDRPVELRACLGSLLALRTPPDELLVVDNAPRGTETERVCRELGVRRVVEELPGHARARNRGLAETAGELVAFTDDDCVVDPGWLDALGEPFSDPLTMAVTGYVAPLELETQAQYRFEAHGGFERRTERTVFDGARMDAILCAGSVGPGASCVFRRTVFAEIGPFAEDLGHGTPVSGGEDAYAFYRILSAGYRVVFEPSRLVWHRHRPDDDGLRRLLAGYASSSIAWTARCLVRHRDPGALRVWRWWWLAHLRRDLVRLVRRRPNRVPLPIVLAEAKGLALGPVALLRSRRSRRGIPAVAPALPPGPERVRATVDEGDPPLHVVVPSYNRRERLATLLRALAAQDYRPDRVEVAVVLDGSTDGSAELARSLPLPFTTHVLEQPNRGIAAARNRGAAAGSAPVVVFLDDDVVPEPGFLAAHARAHRLAAGEHVALGYYPPVLDGGGYWEHALRAWWEDHFRRKGEPGHLWTFLDFVGGNVSLPRRLFAKTGGYDERFRGRREDLEYAIRLLGAGARFAYHPEARAAHHLDTRLETVLRQQRQEGRDDVQLVRVHPEAAALLPLARFVAEGRQPRPGRVAAGLPLLAALERLKRRRRWHILVHRLLAEQYVRGLWDATGGEAGLADLAEAVRAARETVVVDLEAPDAPLSVGGVRAVDLDVRCGPLPVAHVAALEPGGQWDWDEVTRRALRALWEPSRRVLLLRSLGLPDDAEHAPAGVAEAFRA